MGKHERTTRGLALLGQDVVISAVVRYQLRFRQDVNNLALVLIFNFLNILGFSCGLYVFQIPQQRQALFVGCNLKTQY